MESLAKRFSPNTLIVFFLVCFTLLYLAATIVTKRNLVFDDSFITYRYAKNLANGYGITWNPGERPAEGYTNFLLVIILAPFIRLGADPLLVARILSFLSAGGLCLLIYQVAKHEGGASNHAAVLVAISFLLLTETNLLCMVGIETVIYTAVLFLTFVFGCRYLRTVEARDVHLFGLCAFGAILLRPEAVLMVVALSVLVVLRFYRVRQYLISILISFVMPLLIYIIWKQFHFGTVLPNPFFIKVSNSGLFNPGGVRAIIGFAAYNHILVAGALLSFLVTSGKPTSPSRRFAVVFVSLYLLFYLHVETLMNIYKRFLYPLTIFFLYLSLPALLLFFRHLLSWKLTGIWKAPAVCLVIFFAFYPEPLREIGLDLSKALKRNPSSVQSAYRVALALSRYPEIKTTRIAIADAGVIPYFTEAPHLDPVGLNDNFIAREKDFHKLTDYFFAQHPDLIFHPATKDSWITFGHGPLGNYARWALDRRWDGYSYVGTVGTTESLYCFHLFVRRDSERFIALRSFLQRNVIDGYFEPFPIAIGNYKHALTVKPIWIPASALPR